MIAQQPAPANPTTMQDLILTLQNYWAARGCLVAQPINTEVGAGTANPATALRVLGPEAWNVAYVEPSVRPDDSRYGQNPNRLQTHTQFQVILKPDPGNPQELYLESLTALGVDLHRHDVRFVEDNWASPALGAWGLGWEVWLDGLEITQFTYFQQAGGISLNPVAVEITYGLERIMMALQDVSHFSQIRYSDTLTYGEIHGQAEYEMSRYYLDDADVALNRQLFDLYAKEAQRIIDAGLPLPAYQYVLKCSHTFNVLDSRGAISTTERARAFAMMRTLMRGVSQLWVDRRAELNHPLGVWQPEPVPAVPAQPVQTEAAGLLFEIGVEELPAAELPRAIEQVRRLATQKLAQTQLDHGAVDVQATPRRIVLTIAEVQPRERDVTRQVRGPKMAAAYAADGTPTKALDGFLRGQGLTTADVVPTDVNGVAYVSVAKLDAGRPAPDVLAGILGEIVTELRAEKNMRWQDPALSYCRPIRWLLALIGGQPLHVAASALRSGRTTMVLRTAPEPLLTIDSAAGYAEVLRAHGIELDRDARRAAVITGATALAATVGGVVDIDGESGLLDEITDLVERPTPILGTFSAHYLALPAEILTTVMRKHQRYLPVTVDGVLTNHFVAVANADCDHDAVRAGNEAVLRARFEDANFFWEADLKTAPAEFHARLDRLTFEEQLGTMAQRTQRIARLAEAFAGRIGVSEADRATIGRAAELAKFDLTTQLVTELSSLAGVVAGAYAQRAGEAAEVSAALADMERPRTASGALPVTHAGAIMSLADRFDLLASMFAIGAEPTGSSDPFGVRRTALAITRVLRTDERLNPVTVSAGLAEAAGALTAQGVTVDPDRIARAAEFAAQRYEQQLLDAGAQHQLVKAIMPLADRPYAADQALATLQVWTGRETFAPIVAAMQRVRRILPGGAVAPGGLPGTEADSSETALADAVRAVGTHGDLDGFFAAAGELPAAVNAFFDAVLVMDEDPVVRTRRLDLLRAVLAQAPAIEWTAIPS